MNWILEHLQFVVVIALVAGSLFKKLLEGKVPTTLEDQKGGRPPAKDLSSDKSYRKRPASVPPPLARSSGPPPLAPAIPPGQQLAGYDMEAANEMAKAIKHQQDLESRLRQIRENKANTTGGASATRARVAAAKGVAKPFLQTPLALRSRLRDPAEVRRAFVVREILDAPVSLR